MSRASLILRMRRIAGRHAGDSASVALLAFALVIGGPAVLAGLGKVADIVTPDMTARASDASLSANRKLLDPDSLAAPPSPKSHILPDGLRTQRSIAVPVSAVIAPAARESMAALPDSATPAIAICLDDLGADLDGTAKAIALPENVTLAFLPYSQADTGSWPNKRNSSGHEVLAHVPMEPIGPLDPGPMTLKVGARGYSPNGWPGPWRACPACRASTIMKAANSPPTRPR